VEVPWEEIFQISRTAIAIHEAAHAVACRVLGVAVLSVELPPVGPVQPGRRAVVWCDRPGDHEVNAMIAMAGPVAEMIVCPDSSTDRHHRRDKLQAFSAAIGLATGILPGDDVAGVSAAFERLDAAARANVLRIVDRLTADTEALVAKHWPAIRRVTKALLDAGRMDQATLDRLIGCDSVPA
jgi:hypothetical protein